MRNALWTVEKLKEAYYKVNFHIQDGYDTVVARNILIAHIMLSQDFDPENPTDIQYLWDVWYSLQLTESTRKRFVKNVKQLMATCQSNPTIVIPEAKYFKKMKVVFNCRLDAVCNIKPSSVSSGLKERYLFACLNFNQC